MYADYGGADIAYHSRVGGIAMYLAVAATWRKTHYCVGMGDKAYYIYRYYGVIYK